LPLHSGCCGRETVTKNGVTFGSCSQLLMTNLPRGSLRDANWRWTQGGACRNVASSRAVLAIPTCGTDSYVAGFVAATTPVIGAADKILGSL
jgi:hypothetical protein